MKNIGKRIEQLLDELNFSQKDLANVTGISEVSISRYVAGTRTPSLENAAKIARFFNITIECLIGADEPEVKDISVEEAVRRLDILKETSIFERNSFMDEAIRKALDVLDGLTWKDPKKELPESGVEVLIAYKSYVKTTTHHTLGWINFKGNWADNEGEFSYHDDILGWMYIPKEV